jgi:hypothetical protein
MAPPQSSSSSSSSTSTTSTTTATSSLADAGVVSSRFYLYWLTSLPLTLAIFLLWRTWHILQSPTHKTPLPKENSSFIKSFFGRRQEDTSTYNPTPRRLEPVTTTVPGTSNGSVHPTQNKTPSMTTTTATTTMTTMRGYTPAPPYRPGQREVESRYSGLAEGPGSPQEAGYSRQRQLLFARGENVRLRQSSGGV